MKCDKCLKEFPEPELELSHDIPKYLGGTDLDGRHWLCRKHHKEYDDLILEKCLRYCGIEFFSDGERGYWMKDLKKQPEELKEIFKKFAQGVKKEWFPDDD